MDRFLHSGTEKSSPWASRTEGTSAELVDPLPLTEDFLAHMKLSSENTAPERSAVGPVGITSQGRRGSLSTHLALASGGSSHRARLQGSKPPEIKRGR